jgi:meiotically up-regulated gene 157 (Mug157) protein
MPFRRPRSPKHEELYVEAAARRERHQAESFSAFKMTKMNKMVDDACFFPYHVPINHFTDLTIYLLIFSIFFHQFPIILPI